MLSEKQLDRLETLLDESRRFSVEAVDGVFCAAVVGPGQVMPGECLELICYEDARPWASPEQAAEAHELLIGLWNMVADRLARPPEDLEEEALPLVAVPDDMSTEEILGDTDSDFPLAKAWASGFLHGMSLRDADWALWLATDDALIEFMKTLIILQNEPGNDDVIPTLSFHDRVTLLNQIPFHLWTLNRRRLKELHPGTIRHDTRVDRNDSCPCGSGKKYKKCCGQTLH